MEQLNFPAYAFTLKNKENKTYIFDLIRKKNLLLTPEEWVRQHCILGRPRAGQTKRRRVLR